MAAGLTAIRKCAWRFTNWTVFYLSRYMRSSQKTVPSRLRLNVVRDEARSSDLRSPRYLQGLFLSAGLLAPVHYMMWAYERCIKQKTNT